jgi:protein gp37
MLEGKLAFAGRLPNVWWGVSVENIAHGVPRIEELRLCPARTRFLSVEPLLEDVGQLDLRDIHWVITGGESGAKARPMEPGWVRSIRDQCAEAGVPFHFKQWGGRNKKKAGRALDGRTHDDAPAISAEVPPTQQARLLLVRAAQGLSGAWAGRPLLRLAHRSRR